MTPEQTAHLWDLFQPSPDGLGFGLWWVHAFVERQGGEILCDNRPGEGMAFTVRLPASLHPPLGQLAPGE
jgi:signal transduction histidine kinase